MNGTRASANVRGCIDWSRRAKEGVGSVPVQVIQPVINLQWALRVRRRGVGCVDRSLLDIRAALYGCCGVVVASNSPVQAYRLAQGSPRALQRRIGGGGAVRSPSEHCNSSRACAGGGACAGCALARRDGDAACACVLVVGVCFRWAGGAKHGAHANLKLTRASQR